MKERERQGREQLGREEAQTHEYVLGEAGRVGEGGRKRERERSRRRDKEREVVQCI